MEDSTAVIGAPDRDALVHPMPRAWTMPENPRTAGWVRAF